MINFSVVLHLTQNNLSSFSNTLDSILNQEKRFMDMTVISDLPASFDIRTLNTKIINNENSISYNSIFQRCLGSHVIYLNNENSEIIMRNEFCNFLFENGNTLSEYKIWGINNQSAMLIAKEYAVENGDIFAELNSGNEQIKIFKNPYLQVNLLP